MASGKMYQYRYAWVGAETYSMAVPQVAQRCCGPAAPQAVLQQNKTDGHDLLEPRGAGGRR